MEAMNVEYYIPTFGRLEKQHTLQEFIDKSNIKVNLVVDAKEYRDHKDLWGKKCKVLKYKGPPGISPKRQWIIRNCSDPESVM